MLPIDLDAVRLFLHLLAAAIWVGGQVVLAALVPVLKRVAPQAPRMAARQFSRLAWPAFGVLVVTGAWNIAVVEREDAAYRTTLTVKLVVVALSGVTALAHARASSRRAMAVFGALTAVTALGALLLGVMLRA